MFITNCCSFPTTGRHFSFMKKHCKKAFLPYLINRHPPIGGCYSNICHNNKVLQYHCEVKAKATSKYTAKQPPKVVIKPNFTQEV